MEICNTEPTLLLDIFLFFNLKYESIEIGLKSEKSKYLSYIVFSFFFFFTPRGELLTKWKKETT